MEFTVADINNIPGGVPALNRASTRVMFAQGSDTTFAFHEKVGEADVEFKTAATCPTPPAATDTTAAGEAWDCEAVTSAGVGARLIAGKLAYRFSAGNSATFRFKAEGEKWMALGITTISKES